MRSPADLDPRQKRAATAAIVLAFVLTSTLGLVQFDSQASLEASVMVADQTGPDDIHRVTEIDIVVRNEGDLPFEPAFNIIREGLQTRFYWPVKSGPRVLRPGETARYTISAPVVGAAIPFDSRAIISVNDRGTAGQIKQIYHSPQRAPPAVLNPGLGRWRQPPAEGWAHPFRWWAAKSTPGGETAVVNRTGGGVRLAVSGGRRASGPWAMAGVGQNGGFPTSLTVVATPHTVVDEPSQYPRRATGVEIGERNHRVWVIFADVNERQVLYRGGDLSYIMVFVPAEPDRRTRATVDIGALYDRFGWRRPPVDRRRVDGQEYEQRRAHVLAFAAVYPGSSRPNASITVHRIEST